MNQNQSLKTWKYLPLTYELMIPSSVNIENKVLRPDIILVYKKEKKALLIEVLIPVILDYTMQKTRKLPNTKTSRMK